VISNTVKLIECPRDAWQGLSKPIPTEIKADYLRMLVAAGFNHIDAVSFVSPKALPQMADSERVLSFLDLPDDLEIIGIVVNEKGADRAIATGAVSTLGFPYSISPEFLKRNQNQTPEESLDTLEAIGEAAYKGGLSVVAYISMAFGNPYGDVWNIDEVTAACDLLAESGVRQISLADTVGLATPELVSGVFSTVRSVINTEIELGVHLHARPADAAGKVLAAYRAGCRRFDSALGGLGGCPFAQDALVGNIATETVIATLGQRDADLPQLKPLDALLKATAGIGAKFSASQAAD